MTPRSCSHSRWVVAAIALLVISSHGDRAFALPPVKPHVGDGRFENTSWRFPYRYLGMAVLGYTIHFEEFDLSQPFEASYHVEQLPKIPKKVGLYLCIIDPAEQYWNDEARQTLTATVEITVADQNGKVVCAMEQPINKMIWTNGGGPNTFALYNLDQSFFKPQRSARYTIRIKYQPDAALARMKGYLYIRCGGSI
jgi:hypothetical protein